MAEHIGWKPSLTAALGKIGETLAVRQVALTSNLIYTIPEGTPSGIVHRVVFTQDGTGGHTVTYNDLPVTVDTTAGAQTEVELWPNGAATRTVVYPGAAGSGVDTEGVQDVVGAMVAAAGGTYDDAAGTITLPGSGAASMVESVNAVASASGTVGLPGIASATVHDITLAGNVTISLPTGLPAGACSMTVIIRQDATGARAVTWPPNVAWPNAFAPVASTDPGSVTVVALWTLDGGGTWFGALSAANMTPAAPVTPTAPGAPVLTVSGDADSIAATWEPAPANGSPVTSYKVWRGTSAGSLSLLTTTTGTTFAHDDTTATPGTLYYYAVSAVNAVGEGPQSAIQSTMAQSAGSLTLFAADDFNRADAPVSAQQGPGKPASWTTLAWEGPGLVMCGVHSNTLVAGPNTGAARIYIEAGTPDVAVEATFLRANSGLGIRYGTGVYDYYRIGVTSANRMYVYEYSGSSTPANTLLPDTNTTTDIQFGDLVRVEAFGTTIKVLVNGVEQFSFEDTIKNTNTKHGFSIVGNQPTTPAHDDWKLYK